METLHQAVEVIYRKTSECPEGDLHFPFFQMAYVLSGEGLLSINGNRIPYEPGNLMLLTPEDRHNFIVQTPTEFLLVRFSSRYVKEYRWTSIDHLECLLYYASHLSGCILRNASDNILVKSIADSLIHAINRGDMYNEDLKAHFVNALIVIAARNIATIRPSGLKPNADKRVLDIIDYIQVNICDPGRLKASTIAGVFGISDTYLGSYFKSQCGETLQQFITNYKIRLIEHRLRFSDRRINEIAAELGFADESHLNKFFKKQRGQNLTGYRKKAILSA